MGAGVGDTLDVPVDVGVGDADPTVTPETDGLDVGVGVGDGDFVALAFSSTEDIASPEDFAVFEALGCAFAVALLDALLDAFGLGEVVVAGVGTGLAIDSA